LFGQPTCAHRVQDDDLVSRASCMWCGVQLHQISMWRHHQLRRRGNSCGSRLLAAAYQWQRKELAGEGTASADPSTRRGGGTQNMAARDKIVARVILGKLQCSYVNRNQYYIHPY
jgi:hypothetical protein